MAASLTTGTAAQVPRPPGRPSEQPAGNTGGSFLIEQSRTKVRFEDDGTGQRELLLRVKVLDEAAVRQWGNLQVAYQSDTEDLSVKQLQVSCARWMK
jgi:hypothetical protein